MRASDPADRRGCGQLNGGDSSGRADVSQVPVPGASTRRRSLEGREAEKTLTILGANIQDIPSFYAEINRVFMADEDWRLGESLDALDDILRGGYGAVGTSGAVTIVWRDMAAARSSLGLDATRSFLQAKLGHPEIYNAELIGRQLSTLEAGTGPTFFETVLEIIAGHSHIVFVPA